MPSTPEIVIITEAEMERYLAADKDVGLGALLTEKGPLPLKALDVQANLEGLVAEVNLTQTFANTHPEALEATYIFPLPDRAAVTHFRLEVAGRVVEGVLKERAKARQEFDEAIEAGHRAAITEEERPGVFTMRVGNLPPGESATVRLTMVGPLIFDSGEVDFRFPLVVAPRFIPGTPLEGRSVGDGTELDTDAVPDASRITPPVLLPGYPNPVQFSMTVSVQPAQLAPRDFRSSLHSVVSEQLPDGTMRINVQPGDRLNRDFILRYKVGAEIVQSSLTLVPDAAAGEGTFMLTVVPPVCVPTAQRQSRPRNVVFVLDRSGSMEGWKMVAARRALGRMIDTLVDRDRFTVLAFDDSVESPELADGGLISATDRQRFRMIEWLAQIEARGGTEMAQPLQHALTLLAADDGEERIVVLLTDGQVGNEDQILQALGKRMKGIRIFTLGVDRAVNEAFLRRLAGIGGGLCDIVESEDRLDEVMAKVNRRIGTPLLTNLNLDLAQLAVEPDSQVPARLPDLFAGVPVTVFGRYRGQPRGRVVLHATDDAGRAVTQSIDALVGANHAAVHLWARGQLREMEDRWVIDADTPLQEKITALSLKFGVLCRFTAFVAVDRSAVVNKGGQNLALIQPVELPDGWASQQPAARRHAKIMLAKQVLGLTQQFSSAPMQSPAPADDGDMYCSLDGGEDAETNGCGPLMAEYQDEDAAESAEHCNGGPVNGGHDAMVDLAAYRLRAREMLEEWRTDADPAHAFGVLAIKLRALLEDLQSIDAPQDEMASLLEVLDRIQRAIATSQLQKSDKLVIEVERMMRAFAGITATAP